MADKEQGMQKVIDAQARLVSSLRQELLELRKENLRLRTHLEVLCSHPVGIASMKIAKRYSRDTVTKELQKAALN